jgi:plasmid stability protein
MADVKVKATVYLPEEVHRRLKIRAAEEQSSMTDLVLHAVEDLLQRPVRLGRRQSGTSGSSESR